MQKLAPLEVAEHSTSVEHSLCPGYPMPDYTPSRRVCFYDSQTVSDGGNNPVQTTPSELAEHSTSREVSSQPSQPEMSDPRTEIRRGVVGDSVNQPGSELMEQSNSGDKLRRQAGPLILKSAPAEDTEQRRSIERSPPEVALNIRQGPARIDQPEYTGSRPESGEAIVVGAIGLAAPWFLTGWAHDVKIEFMIDTYTGCQVTILSTTVFQRMLTVNPAVRSALQTFRRRLVSADSSPLTVQGQLELDIVFPGLCCKMLFVVANIGSDGLLGTEALQSYLPHQLDLRTGQLWADGWSTLQLHQQRSTPDLDGLLTTSVAIPPDSEIVAKLSVSGIRPHGCALVKPARCLVEEYGVVVGHTLVDASSGSGSVLIANPNAEVVVLPGLTLIGKLVPVVAISVAIEDTVNGPAALPEYLEENR